MTQPDASALFNLKTIYAEEAAAQSARGQAILANWPQAQVVPVPSHWQIAALNQIPHNAEAWARIKREVLVLGTKKRPEVRPNGRSADYILSGASNGCALACAYCYVARRKGYANPVTLFTNTEEALAAQTRHLAKLGPKVPNQVDAGCHVYEIGENGDLSVDALLTDIPQTLIQHFRQTPGAKATFATKFVNPALLGYDPQGKTRIRFSLMPAHVAKVVDVRTTPVPERITAINDFVAAGYEVHLNFSPVIIYPGWTQDWAQLFAHLADVLSPAAKAQLAAEVIFLTHNEELHEINLQWHPKAEELLWTPQWQETKQSQTGGTNVRYRHGQKGRLVAEFKRLLALRLPECRVRYAF